MLSKEAISQLTDAIWERLAGDVATGRGMLKSSVHEAVAGWVAVVGQEDDNLKASVRRLTDAMRANKDRPAGEKLTGGEILANINWEEAVNVWQKARI